MLRPALLLAAVALAVPAPAPAVVAPKDCGFKTVGGKRYNVKADGVTCSWAKPRAVAYLRSGARPSGWSCRKYSPSVTSMRFKCSKGTRKTFFAIRR